MMPALHTLAVRLRGHALLVAVLAAAVAVLADEAAHATAGGDQ
ncbi:hypothetical protein [Protofrankia symbiont of Coriaria ruscifolia]|uniref:Putative secreted protein n=1 Tax=Candidatus Protofrankia californiensis TaxID=1839754 RepID=A0A1C3PBY5_9ACTN|nr:hypothetical protein [Protofrankia symbiont of Coriaria ruscifolia]SBW27312.1 putative secreted protein [Candidatus Protofrankia californiensis]